MRWSYTNLHFPAMIKFKILYAVLWISNTATSFPTDAESQAKRYSIAISIANIQVSYILQLHRLRSLQDRHAMIFPRNRIISFLSQYKSNRKVLRTAFSPVRTVTLLNKLQHGCFPEDYKLNLLKLRVNRFLAFLFTQSSLPSHYSFIHTTQLFHHGYFKLVGSIFRPMDRTRYGSS